MSGKDAAALVEAGVQAVAEGANMPCTPEAISVLQENGVLFAPGKASNAGGIGTSGLEMSQNSLRMSWTREEVDAQLEGIMKLIHRLFTLDHWLNTRATRTRPLTCRCRRALLPHARQQVEIS